MREQNQFICLEEDRQQLWNKFSWGLLIYYSLCPRREQLFLLYYSESFTLAAGQFIVLIR